MELKSPNRIYTQRSRARVRAYVECDIVCTDVVLGDKISQIDRCETKQHCVKGQANTYTHKKRTSALVIPNNSVGFDFFLLLLLPHIRHSSVLFHHCVIGCSV